MEYLTLCQMLSYELIHTNSSNSVNSSIRYTLYNFVGVCSFKFIGVTLIQVYTIIIPILETSKLKYRDLQQIYTSLQNKKMDNRVHFVTMPHEILDFNVVKKIQLLYKSIKQNLCHLFPIFQLELLYLHTTTKCMCLCMYIISKHQWITIIDKYLDFHFLLYK